MRIRQIITIIFTIILAVFTIACINQDPAKTSGGLKKQQLKPYSYVEQEVSFINEKDGAHLSGTLTIPKHNGKFPAVILISGSGLQDRNESVYGHEPFKVLADHLSHNNIAVLRYDDRGFGKSTGPLNNVNPVNFAEDAYAGLQYLKSREEIFTDKIGIIGHSMGAVEGSILASRYSDISFLIMLAGAGIPLDENMLLADSVSNTKSGQSKAVSSGQVLLKKMITEVKTDSDSNITEARLIRIIKEWQDSLPQDEKVKIDAFTRDKPGYWHNMASEWATPYFNFVLNYDPYPVLKEISCPVLSIIGEKDVQTLAVENSNRIKQALKNGKCIDYQIEIIDNLNHLFQTCETGAISEYSQIKETFNVGVMEIISSWIKKQTN